MTALKQGESFPQSAEGAPSGGKNGAGDRLEFQNTVEGVMVRSIGPHMTPALRTKLKAAGLDLSKTLLPAYPATLVFQWIAISARELWPQETEGEALRSFGALTLSGLGETMLGKALKATLMLIGPRRTLQRAQRAFRTNNNYTEVKVSELSPTCMELQFNHVNGFPTFYQGVLGEACELLGTRNCSVDIVDRMPPGATFRIKWDER